MLVLAIAAFVEKSGKDSIAAFDPPGFAEKLIFGMRANWSHVVHAAVHQGLGELLEERGDCLLAPVRAAQRPFIADQATSADNRRSHPPERFPKSAEKRPVVLELSLDAALRDVYGLPLALGAARAWDGAPHQHRSTTVAALEIVKTLHRRWQGGQFVW